MNPESIIRLAQKMNVKDFCMFELAENPQFDEVLPPDDRFFTGEWRRFGKPPLILEENSSGR